MHVIIRLCIKSFIYYTGKFKIQHAYSYRFYDIDIMELELYENFAILTYARPNSIFYEIILLF